MGRTVRKRYFDACVSVPRHFIFPKDSIVSVHLVGFSDASKDAYAAVVYLVSTKCRGEKASHICAAKSRVSPIAKQSIPRLELLGALILSRLTKSVKRVLEEVVEIKYTTHCSDSQAALAWIKNTNGTYKQYVQDRAKEVRLNSDLDSWHYVPTKCNPADIASRGCLGNDFDFSRWEAGPAWLCEPRENWPINSGVDLNFGAEELKRRVVTLVSTDNPEIGLHKLIQIDNFSTVGRLLRVTAWVMRFLRNLMQRIGRETTGDLQMENKISRNVETELDAIETSEALTMWIRHSQGLYENRKGFEQTRYALRLFKDSQGIWRCNGRLQNAELRYDSRYPILLDPEATLTTLLIRRAHDEVFHNGTPETLTQLRATYWVTKGRQRVKTIVKRCALCRRLEGPCYGIPQTPPLPKNRVAGGSFESAGIDYCGPLFVKQEGTENNSKVYIAILTCTSTRMIHLEVTPDLAKQALVRCLKRAFARRGKPSLIVSDNAKTFKAKFLKTFLAREGITWTFNLAKAPWWGGIFERLIRSVKRCLKKVLGRKLLTFEQLYTVVCQVEQILNSRPLTYLYPEQTEILTPSHLHCGRRLLDPPLSFLTEPQFLTEEEARLSVSKLDKVVQHFWSIWQKQYLINLRENAVFNGKNGQLPEVGDIVVVHDERKRHLWRLGKIEGLISGKDGNVRGAKLRVSETGKRPTVLERPLQKLFPLEMRDTHKIPDNPTPKSVALSKRFVQNRGKTYRWKTYRCKWPCHI